MQKKRMWISCFFFLLLIKGNYTRFPFFPFYFHNSRKHRLCWTRTESDGFIPLFLFYSSFFKIFLRVPKISKENIWNQVLYTRIFFWYTSVCRNRCISLPDIIEKINRRILYISVKRSFVKNSINCTVSFTDMYIFFSGFCSRIDEWIFSVNRFPRFFSQLAQFFFIFFFNLRFIFFFIPSPSFLFSFRFCFKIV